MNVQGLADIIRSRRLDVSRLSERSGVTADRINAIINGEDPTLGELRRLSNALRVRIFDLLPTEQGKPTAQWLFRALGAKQKNPDPAALSSLSRKIEYSIKLLGPQPAAVRSWLGQFNRGASYADADENAGIFRHLFYHDDQVSPILSLPNIVMDRLGILLFIVDSSSMDGASAYFDGVPYVFVSNRFPPRMLFTLAHELGHILAHHDPTESFATFDESREDEPDLRPSAKGEESYAHAFASCLLMPSAGVGIALQKIRAAYKVKEDSPVGDIEVLALSRIFGLSFAAAARRCEDLRLLPRGGARSLDDWLKKEYGSAEKRAESVGLPPRPKIEFPRVPERLLASAIEQIRAGKISVGRASAVLGISISDLLTANRSTVH
jgi:Zn-dependent peptidase ImmA (M78 family)/transcriptional regulator with XRE-family HTH domain